MNAIIKGVTLNDYLSVKSNWPKRLLGLEGFHLERTADAALAEYDEDRYRPLVLDEAKSLEELKLREFENLGMLPDEPHFYSIGEEVFVSPLRMVRTLWYSIILEAVKRFAQGSICELGCGYGFNLSLLKNAGFADVYGGDFSSYAVGLGAGLGCDISQFNYYDEGDYVLIKEGSTVLTVHSLEQLPSASCFLSNLVKVRDRINRVIHIEPTFLPERSSFFGLIRNRYNQLIDHNHDLVELLRARGDIEILHFAADVFGLHPLNSSNVIVWKFRD